MAEEDLKYAWELYNNAVAAEGSMRQQLLRKAENVLQNVPSGYKNRDDLMSRIKSMQ